MLFSIGIQICHRVRSVQCHLVQPRTVIGTVPFLSLTVLSVRNHIFCIYHFAFQYFTADPTTPKWAPMGNGHDDKFRKILTNSDPFFINMNPRVKFYSIRIYRVSCDFSGNWVSASRQRSVTDRPHRPKCADTDRLKLNLRNSFK